MIDSDPAMDVRLFGGLKRVCYDAVRADRLKLDLVSR